MGLIRFLAVAAAFWMSLSPSLAKDLLVAVMKSEDGKTTMHEQAVVHEDCLGLLDDLRRQRDAGGDAFLTFTDPQFIGTVVEAYCVQSDGSIVGMDGIVDLPKQAN